MNAVDTNILIYVQDPRNTCKQSVRERQNKRGLGGLDYGG